MILGHSLCQTQQLSGISVLKENLLVKLLKNLIKCELEERLAIFNEAMEPFSKF